MNAGPADAAISIEAVAACSLWFTVKKTNATEDPDATTNDAKREMNVAEVIIMRE